MASLDRIPIQRLFPEGGASKLSYMMKQPLQRFLPLLALWLLYPAPLPAAGQSTDNTQRYDSRALSHYLDGDLYVMQEDYPQAAAAYQRALTYDSTSATIYLSLAKALMQINELERAKVATERALRLEPEDPLAYDLLVQNAIARENYVEAIRYLDEWTQLDPADLDPLFRKAGIQYQQREFAQVIDTYLMIYERDSRQVRVLTRAGELTLFINDYDRAFQVYQRLHLADTDDIQNARTYAEISTRTQHFDEAARVYEHLHQTGDASPANRLQLAWIYWQQEQYPRSKVVLDGLIEEGDRRWDVLSIAGRLAHEQSDYKHLAAISNMMVQVYPDSVGGYVNLATAASQLDDRQQAIEYLEEALDRFPDDARLNASLGNLYLGAQRFHEAEERLRIALELVPDSRQIRFLLASTWSSLRKFTLVDSLFEDMIAADADDAGAKNNYAWSIVEREQVTQKQLRYARKMSRQSLKLAPDNAAFLDTYGWIRYRMGWNRTARRYLQKSIDIDPGNAVVLDHLGTVYLKLGKPEDAQAMFDRAEQIRLRNIPAG